MKRQVFLKCHPPWEDYPILLLEIPRLPHTPSHYPCLISGELISIYGKVIHVIVPTDGFLVSSSFALRFCSPLPLRLGSIVWLSWSNGILITMIQAETWNACVWPFSLLQDWAVHLCMSVLPWEHAWASLLEGWERHGNQDGLVCSSWPWMIKLSAASQPAASQTCEWPQLRWEEPLSLHNWSAESGAEDMAIVLSHWDSGQFVMWQKLPATLT